MDLIRLAYLQGSFITCLVQFSHFSFLFMMVTSDIVQEIPAEKNHEQWHKVLHLAVEKPGLKRKHLPIHCETGLQILCSNPLIIYYGKEKVLP